MAREIRALSQGNGTKAGIVLTDDFHPGSFLDLGGCLEFNYMVLTRDRRDNFSSVDVLEDKLCGQ